MKRLAGFFFGLLLVLMGCTTAGERARMRAGLDSINTRNRNDQPFTVQDVDPYVRFFDRHGTANDRLLTHYLLGRAYYELCSAITKPSTVPTPPPKTVTTLSWQGCMGRWHWSFTSKAFSGNS